MPDYTLKQECLSLGLDKVMRVLSRQIYKNRDNPDKALELNDVWYENGQKYGKLWIEARRLNSALYSRSHRLWKRIYGMMISGDCIFLTFTFTDEVLNKTTYEIRRRRVREFLKAHSDYYVANIDFGEKNGREHWHAVILADNVDYTMWHKNGAINGKKCNASVDDAKRLSKYVSKLTNHAIKETAGKNYLIYGRKMNIFD